MPTRAFTESYLCCCYCSVLKHTLSGGQPRFKSSDSVHSQDRIIKNMNFP